MKTTDNGDGTYTHEVEPHDTFLVVMDSLQRIGDAAIKMGTPIADAARALMGWHDETRRYRAFLDADDTATQRERLRADIMRQCAGMRRRQQRRAK